MGEAKRRGTFETRKAEAIAAESKQAEQRARDAEARAARFNATIARPYKQAPRPQGRLVLAAGLALAASMISAGPRG